MFHILIKKELAFHTQKKRAAKEELRKKNRQKERVRTIEWI